MESRGLGKKLDDWDTGLIIKALIQVISSILNHLPKKVRAPRAGPITIDKSESIGS